VVGDMNDTYYRRANWLRWAALIIGLSCAGGVFFSVNDWLTCLIIAILTAVCWTVPIIGILLIAWGLFGSFLLLWAVSMLGYSTGPTTGDLLFAIFNSLLLIVGIIFFVSNRLAMKARRKETEKKD